MNGAGKYPKRLQIRLEIVLESVLKGGGTLLIIIPCNTGNENPPQKN